MADPKKYYYMRIKDSFYDSDEMILLQAFDNGYKYSDILMKMYLKSLKFDGRLVYKENIPYDIKMISVVTRHDPDVVSKALEKFVDLGLIELLDNGTIYMTEIQNFIGTSSDEADRKREYRNRIEHEKKNQLELPIEVKETSKDKCPDKIAYTIFYSNFDSNYIFNSKEIKKFDFFKNEEVNKLFIDYLLIRPKFKRPPINSHLAIVKLYNKLEDKKDDLRIEMLEKAITQSWKDLYIPERNGFNNKQDKPKTQYEKEQEQIVKDRYSKYKV